jgi:uncharacterized protein YfaS (alpha-2-macroglobulin family)
MNIGIDFDGVVVMGKQEIFDRIADEYANTHGIKVIDPNGTKLREKYDLDDTKFKEMYSDIYQKINKVMDTKKGIDELEIVEGFPDAFAKLKNDGHKLYLITARTNEDAINIGGCSEQEIEENRKYIIEWLKNKDIVFDGYSFGNKIKTDACLGKKAMVNKDYKIIMPLKENNKIEIMIDDSKKHHTELNKVGVSTIQLLADPNDKYSNRPDNKADNTPIVHSWGEITDRISLLGKPDSGNMI